jgi:GT2 family glycosyltransferase
MKAVGEHSMERNLAEREHWPTVTVVVLVYNRKEELRETLQRMQSCDYNSELLDIVVVDNASSDGSSTMVTEEFPEVRVIRREENAGTSGWNDGFAIAKSDWVLALDDDCYLDGDGLKRAIAAAEEREADLVSFEIGSSFDPDFKFNDVYATGLLSFWGCAVLMRREVIERLGGFDPEIFVWAHELEFMLRFYDAGFRHLHLPEVRAIHMKDVSGRWIDYYSDYSYLVNARHFTYVAAKHLRARDAFEALIARLATHVREGMRIDRFALKAIGPSLRGFAHGWRHRSPVRNKEISRIYRRNFETFASPWWMARPVSEIARRHPGPGRRERYFTERRQYYPDTAATLDF